MKYMILVYASQRDYDAMVGKPAPGEPGWTGADFAALGQFMERSPGISPSPGNWWTPAA